MAPALSVPWGSGSAGSAFIGDLTVVGTITAFSAFLLLALLLVLCASCHGQKKAAELPGDHENLMNGVSEKETCSQSADTASHGTDLAASSSHNGLTSGTVLTDTMDTSPHPSEEMLSSQSEHRFSKCPQDRELPSIPCSNTLQEADNANGTCGPPEDGTYEVLKDSASRDRIVEDSPYETFKDQNRSGLTNGTLSRDTPSPTLLNGKQNVSPGTPDLCPLTNGAEYASIDLNKKSRYSVDVETRSVTTEEDEEEKPPPIPDKVLDENDNHDIKTLQNGELQLPLSSAPDLLNPVAPDMEVSAMYSRVVNPQVEDNEHDYSSISEIRGAVVESSSNELYATVKDMYPSPPAEQPAENPDPGYETIKFPKTSVEHGLQDNRQMEPDYESVGELGLNSETSRL